MRSFLGISSSFFLQQARLLKFSGRHGFAKFSSFEGITRDSSREIHSQTANGLMAILK